MHRRPTACEPDGPNPGLRLALLGKNDRLRRLYTPSDAISAYGRHSRARTTAFGGLKTAFGRHLLSNASQAYGLHTPSDAIPAFGRHSPSNESPTACIPRAHYCRFTSTTNLLNANIRIKHLAFQIGVRLILLLSVGYNISHSMTLRAASLAINNDPK